MSFNPIRMCSVISLRYCSSKVDVPHRSDILTSSPSSFIILSLSTPLRACQLHLCHVLYDLVIHASASYSEHPVQCPLSVMSNIIQTRPPASSPVAEYDNVCMSFSRHAIAMFLFCNSWHHFRKALTLSEDFRESCGRRSKSKFILCSEKRLKFVRPLCACCHADNMYVGVIDWNIGLYVNHLDDICGSSQLHWNFGCLSTFFFSICRSLHDGILRSWVAPCSTVVTLRMFKTNLIIPYDRCPSHLTDRLRPVNSSRFMTSYVTSSTSAIMCGDLFHIGKN